MHQHTSDPPRTVARTATPVVHAIRGAITVTRDSPTEIYAATRAMLHAIMQRNALPASDIVSAFFTVTHDLTSAFPARVTQEMGLDHVAALCALEIPVPGALARCIRVLLHVRSSRATTEIVHVYERGARRLRPDRCDPSTSQGA